MPIADDLAAQLLAFCRAQMGGGDARVEDLAVLDGHAGFSYGFRLVSGSGAGVASEPLVLRLPPPGVRFVGPADVLRQARLLEALKDSGVPVAPVRWSGDDPRWFGRPYTIVERLPGATLQTLDRGAAAGAVSAEAMQMMAEQAVQALATLHRLDWRARLPDWGPPSGPTEMVGRWDFLIDRAADPALVAQAPALRERLLASAPPAGRSGIVHGDFQWSNLLFEGGRLRAVLDWEIAGIAETPLDLGWLMVFSDPESWAPSVRWSLPLPSPEWLLARYTAALGEEPRHAGWYRALAGYIFALIASFNLMLHRRGKRVDPYYEVLAPSIPVLLGRAGEILDGSR